MSIGYAEVVATLAFGLAVYSLVLERRDHKSEPEQAVRVHKAIQSADQATEYLPVLRGRVTGAIQFLDEPQWRVRGALITKQRTRLQALYDDWGVNRHLVTDRAVLDAMANARVLEEIMYLDDPGDDTDDELHAHLVKQKAALQRALAAIDAID